MPRVQETELKKELRVTLCDQVTGIRQRRLMVEQHWLQARRTWMDADVAGRFVGSDTSTHYHIPAARRVAERSIVRIVKLLTPTVKWFQVGAMAGVPEDKLSNVDKYMWYILRKRIKSRTNISQLVRSMYMCGTCHLKTGIMVRNGQVWPSQRVIDPFAFYQFPETAASIDETEILFEDFLFSYNRYRTFVDKGIVDDIPQDRFVKPDWPYHLVERLAYQGITDPTADVPSIIQQTSDRLEKTSTGFVSLTEMWMTREDKLYQVYIAWNLKNGPRIVGFIQSVYDEPLYRSVIHRPLPGETYTNSMMGDLTELDMLQKDQLNKFQEAVDAELGWVAIDQNVISRTDNLKMKGREIWKVNGDPREAINFMQPPITSTNQLRAWQIYLANLGNSGGGTLAEGQPGRNMPRAGGAVQSLITLGMADLQDIAELIEQEVLTPSLGDIYKVSSQFIPPDQLMNIPGGEGLYGNILKKENLVGDYEFEWIGSLQSQDQEQRAQRSLIFLNLLPQLAPYLAQQGYAPNMVELIRMVWRDSLGERGLSDVVVPINELKEQAAAMATQSATQGMMQQSGGQGGQQGVPQDPAQQGVDQQAGSGVAGLKYNLPSVTGGFVKQ